MCVACGLVALDVGFDGFDDSDYGHSDDEPTVLPGQREFSTRDAKGYALDPGARPLFTNDQLERLVLKWERSNGNWDVPASSAPRQPKQARTRPRTLDVRYVRGGRRRLGDHHVSLPAKPVLSLAADYKSDPEPDIKPALSIAADYAEPEPPAAAPPAPLVHTGKAVGTYRRVYYLHVRMRRIFDDDPRLPAEDTALVVAYLRSKLRGQPPTQALIKQACRELIDSREDRGHKSAPGVVFSDFRMRMERAQRKWLQIYYAFGMPKPPGTLLQYNALLDGVLPAVEERLVLAFKSKVPNKRWFLPGGYDALLLLFAPELAPWLRLTSNASRRAEKFAQLMKTELPGLMDFCRRNSLAWDAGSRGQTK